MISVPVGFLGQPKAGGDCSASMSEDRSTASYISIGNFAAAAPTASEQPSACGKGSHAILSEWPSAAGASSSSVHQQHMLQLHQQPTAVAFSEQALAGTTAAGAAASIAAAAAGGKQQLRSSKASGCRRLWSLVNSVKRGDNNSVASSGGARGAEEVSITRL